MEVEIRLQLVLAAALVLGLLIAYMVIIRTIGAVGHAINRMESLINQELELSYNKIFLERKITIQTTLLDKDRSRRNELLLNIPSVRDTKGSAGQENPKA